MKHKPRQLPFVLGILLLLLSIAVIVIGKRHQTHFAFPLSKTGTPKTAATKIKKGKESFIKSLPSSYETPAEFQGTLQKITYTTTLSTTGQTVTKNAMVYLPYGYEKTKKYNILYLMHGAGASYQTFLGSTLSPRSFKNILDHMIQSGTINPLIVVTPTISREYNDYYKAQEGLVREMGTDLIPLVESRFSTYAKSTSEKDIIASRKHRAFGGFSMGGCITWRMLRSHVDYFYYFLPISMPMYYDNHYYVPQQSKNCAWEIANGVRKSGFKKNQYYIFAASGDDDFMSNPTKQQINDLKKYPNQFTSKNITFHSWKGHYHRYFQSFPYIYNGLRNFFQFDN